MSLQLRLFVLILFLLLSLPGAAAADELSAGVWPASGSQMWRISFPADGASELRYPQNNTYITASYENGPPRQSRLRVEGGIAGSMKPGVGSDSDWDYARSSSIWYYGEFKTGGSASYVNIDWVRPAGDNEYFIGYGYRRNAFRMTDGLYYVLDYAAQSPPTSLPDLASSYTATYQGPRVGISGKSTLSRQVSVVGSVAYSPLALVQGRGWWNLRDLSFAHTGVGQMVDAYVGLRYAPSGMNGAMTAGYRYQYMSLFRGTENTSTDIAWDEAANVQKGFYFASEFRF